MIELISFFGRLSPDERIFCVLAFSVIWLLLFLFLWITARKNIKEKKIIVAKGFQTKNDVEKEINRLAFQAIPPLIKKSHELRHKIYDLFIFLPLGFIGLLAGFILFISLILSIVVDFNFNRNEVIGLAMSAFFICCGYLLTRPG